VKEEHKILIIAEAGINHNGSLDMARQIIEAAAEAGADIVKFQTYTADAIVAQGTDKAKYQKETTGDSESQYEMLKKLELNRDSHVKLMTYCDEKGVEFLSSPFDHNSIDMLAELKLKRFKVPSGEITNLPYLRHIGKYGKPIILSTGMSTLKEIEAALKVLETSGIPRDKITVLHCNTEYPTPMEDVNLKAMLTIRDTFSIQVGYSDHTLGVEVPIAAVAIGATVIEKHLTLDRNLPGPDHCSSMEPDELKAMVHAIRNIEKAFGDGIKRPSLSEEKNKPCVRKSIVAKRDIKRGEILTEENLAVKRPGFGISPMRWDEVVGSIAIKDWKADDLIEV
jgi:N,N'-diacetyllegionaminate synthase